MANCPNCGANVGEQDTVCGNCGTALGSQGQQGQQGQQNQQGQQGQPQQGQQGQPQHGQGGQGYQDQSQGQGQPQQGQGGQGYQGQNQPRQGQGGQGYQGQGQPRQGQGRQDQGRGGRGQQARAGQGHRGQGQPQQGQGRGRQAQGQGHGQPRQGQGRQAQGRQPQGRQAQGRQPQGRQAQGRQPQGGRGQHAQAPQGRHRGGDDTIAGYERRDVLKFGGGAVVLAGGGYLAYSQFIAGSATAAESTVRSYLKAQKNGNIAEAEAKLHPDSPLSPSAMSESASLSINSVSETDSSQWEGNVPANVEVTYVTAKLEVESSLGTQSGTILYQLRKVEDEWLIYNDQTISTSQG